MYFGRCGVSLHFTTNPVSFNLFYQHFRLGLATAPVLFAAESYPELDPMIKRRFCESGDVERAFELVLNSNGLDRTKGLANEYGQAALDNIKTWTESTAKEELKELVNLFINRMV